MKRYKLSTLIKMCLIAISCLAFVTACEKQDVVDTNQLGGGEVLLRSFGPSPIARGGELRIIGANMDKVESVTLQGSGTITDIKRISKTEIRVTVPQDAMPGVITIAAGGKTITSLAPLTFSEPISITGIAPMTAKAGDVIKITGEYLNLIEEIIFNDGVHVLKADFKSQSRQEIDVAVPVKAQTGKIIVSNGADIIPDANGNVGVGIPIWVYSDDELNVTLPAITKISPNPVKAGALLTIEGTNFDLVDSVAFGGNVGTRSFASHTATKITVTVPANAADGHIKAIAFSGVPVLSSDSLVMVVPTITSIDPNPVKNGATLTIKGTDLDLVNSVVFGGNKTGTILDGRTATQIQITVPKDAKDGVTLNMLSGKKVEYAALKMVVPTVTAYSPTSAPAGSNVILKGTDLDLVTSVTFAEGLVVQVKPTSATELTVAVPVTAVSGAVVLTLTNGNTVNCPKLDIISPVFAYLPTPPAADAEIHAGELLLVDVGNGNKLTDVQVNGVSTKFILNDPKLYILIPTRAAGKCELKLISSNGSVSYTIPVIGAGFSETVVWNTPIVMSGWSGSTSIPNAGFSELQVGNTIRFYFSSLGANPVYQIWYGDWGSQIVPEVHLDAGAPYYEMTVTADMIQHMMNPAWGSDALLVQGDGVTISKITIIAAGAPAETVLWKGSVGPIGWSGGDKVPVDPSQMAGATTLGIDFTCSSTTNYWQAQVMHGSWWTIFPGWVTLAGGMNGANAIVSFAADDTNVEFPITQSDIDAIAQQGNAILFGGNGLVITRVYVK